MGNLALRAWNIRDGKTFPGRKIIVGCSTNEDHQFDAANQFVRREYRRDGRIILNAVGTVTG
jgi:hypothetical protein